MQIILAALLWIACFQLSSGLKCMTCVSQKGTKDCDISGEIRDCSPSEASCETVVRRVGSSYFVSKGCKQTRACFNNQLQNDRPSGATTQCNSDQQSSLCTCCCQGDDCNAGDTRCVKYPGTCPPPPKILAHGTMRCTNDECKYECTTPEYSLYPPGTDTNVCRSNGTWQIDTPCCARPCPPYILYDSVLVFHSSYSETQEARTKVFLDFFKNIEIGEDSVKMSTIAYSGIPEPNSLVRFDDYGNDKMRMLQMIMEKRSAYTNTPDGEVNAGLAISYAIDNLYKKEMGARGPEVPKSLTISLDSNPTDDAVTAARRARSLGIETHVFAFHPPIGELDLDLLEEVAGNPKHLFVFDGDAAKFTGDYMADINSHFCQDPCEITRSAPHKTLCPEPPKTLAHGAVHCTNDECKYACTTPEYSLYPPGTDTNVCTSNGTWKFDTPCCARPCPPYILYDSALVFHSSYPETEDAKKKVFMDFFQNVEVGENGVKMSSIAYSGFPNTSSLVSYNDYDNDKMRMLQLITEKSSIPNTADGEVNTGMAIDFAINNIFTEANGVRGTNVPKAMIIVLDINPTDDAVSAAQRARSLGIETHVFAFHPPVGELDLDLLTEIAGNAKHLFVFDGDAAEFSDEYLADINMHFCQDPCKNTKKPIQHDRCPTPSTTLAHGTVHCTNDECKYECTTPEYSLYPPGTDTNLCTFKGTWQFDTPCCARPCPPYILYDSALVFHSSYSETKEARNKVFLDFFKNVEVGENGVKMSLIAYSGFPNTSSIVSYNDYGNDKMRMLQLIAEKSVIPNTADGAVNTGKAIDFAIGNIFTEANGARGTSVPRAMTIVLDKNPTDDAVSAAQRARSLGIETHVFAFHPPVGKLDLGLLEEIAGNPKHLFVFDGDAAEFTEEYLADINMHFCQNPCKNTVSSTKHGACPSQPNTLAHGAVSCTNDECKYECTTPEYSLYPPDTDTNVCRSNGTWQFDTPCCARPCPPYILLDSVMVFHSSYPETGDARTKVFLDFFKNVAVGDEAVKMALIAYSGFPDLNSVVRYDEYNNNKTRMTEMIFEKSAINNTPDGQVNTGLAINYAVDNLYSVEVGARPNVAKSMTIVLDSNPTDDAVTAARAARSRGIETHVFAFHPPVGDLDLDLLEEIAGNPKHLFVFDGDAAKFTGDYLADVNSHFCQNPCLNAFLF